MKKITISLVAVVAAMLLPVSSFAASATFDDGTTWNCDQYFAPEPVRYWTNYTFSDNFINYDTSRNVYLNTFQIQYKGAQYLSAGSDFAWTQAIRNANFTVSPGQTISTLTTGPNWAIVKHPTTRATGAGYDFMIGYNIAHDLTNNYPDASDDIQHVECQPYYITWCGDGVVDPGYETCDPAAPGQSPTTCSVTTCTPIVTPPVCNPAKTGTQPAPVSSTDTLCTVGTVSAFVTTASGNTTNYTWSCNTNTAVNCSANYTPTTSTAFDLSIKKYISTGTGVELDAQSGSAVAMNTGAPFNYVIRVKNEGTGATYGVTTMKDILPAGVTLSGTVTGSGWACTASGQTVSCTTSAVIVSGSTFADIIVPVRVTATTGTIVNNALVHNPNETNPCKTDGSMPAGDESACTKDPKNVDPAYIVVTPVGSPFLTIRKFAKGIDSQTQSGQVVIGSGEVYPYTFVVTNSGTAVVLGARVIDTLPAGIEIIGTPTGTGWACTMSGQTMDCMYDTPIAIGATAPTITAQARIRSSVPSGVSIRNVAAVCARNPSMPATDPANACIPDPVLCKIGDLNYDPVTKQCDPATVVLTGTGFDLSLKKYISTGTGVENDAQIGSGLTLNSGLSMNYVIRVKNEGPQTTTGTTTVRDVLPTGVTASGAATGSGWICTASGASLSCDTTQVVASGSTFTDIIVPVRITAGANSTVTNYAVVYNPYEENPCKTDASMPVGNETSCTKDPKNIDPAQFTVPGGGGGGDSYIGKVCVNGIASCASYSTLSACTAAGVPASLCYISGASGSLACQNQSLSCGGGGGGGGGGGNYCGDGVLQVGEECDVVGAAWCVSCKLDLTTNPGANPVTDLWITIPTLSNVRFGYDWIDGQPGKLPFSSNGVVTGVGGKVFTLADVVGFGVKTKYTIPLMIEANKQICLKGTGNSIDNNTICTTFGEAAGMSSNSDVSIFTRSTDGKKFVIIGKGDYQYQSGSLYYGATSNSANNIDLFRGPTLYRTPESNNGPTLNSAFQGVRTGTDGDIALVACTSGDCSVDLAHMGVRVSGAMVGTSGTPVNRSIATFVTTTPQSILAGFGIGTQSTTTTSTTTDTVATNTLGNVSLVGVSKGDKSVEKISDIPALNGNQNIRAIKGNLNVMCPPANKSFELVGVVTIIVEGNITFNCNTAYASNDTTSSVAWIAKGGNITVDKSVTNLAGVYVAIPAMVGDTTTTGQFKGTDATNTILKIDGSLYGNANPLFTSRLYARGTSAYDILTTGTIITYSNRALVNPPPLLSQYLGNYSVERVVK